ncbi:MAG: hypothetical protein IPK88_10355 [Saprospiraceae bacterium]|nr:hypothetical protein [Candidatus Defluviibacterium haderslevense]
MNFRPILSGSHDNVLTACAKIKFEVDIRGCFREIQLVLAPNVVGPNATDPRKKVFCITALSRTESCTFNSKHLKLSIFRRLGTAFE